MTTYEQACRDAAVAGENKDCAIKAVCIATKQSYQYILGAFRICGRKEGEPTPFAITRRVMKCLDYHLVTIELSSVKGATVRTISRNLERGIYLLRTKDHILCVRNGKAHDWTAGGGYPVKTIDRVERWYCANCGSISNVDQYTLPPAKFYELPRYIRDYFQRHYSTELSTEIMRLYPRNEFRKKRLCENCRFREGRSFLKG